MSHVTQRPEFVAANAGFAHEFQLVDVADCSETEPTAYFYQNIAEAEYMAACAAVQEAKFLRNVLADFEVAQPATFRFS